jgi:osmoprotectant transport system permease protein
VISVAIPAWTGPGGIAHRLVQHLGVCALALGICCLLALPVAVWLGRRHRGRGSGGALSVTVIDLAGRAVPAVALLAALAVGSSRSGIGDPTVVTVVALVLIGLPPLLSATYRGTRAVDADIREASRALGMSERRQLWTVDLRLAAPQLLTGLRRSAVRVVAVATTAALVAGPGLGELIIGGLRHHDDGETLTGAVVVTVLALSVDLVLSGLIRLSARRLA